ncbi:MAG TPA: hypothetical protein VKM93_19195 [Terriglobia bacterium]|nr:hypothetical protein [Terriglobia bacterium]
MNHRMIYRMLLAAVVFVLFAASLGLAHTVTIGKGARLGNGPEVQPGTYRLEVIKNQSTTEAAFYKGRDLVVRVPITLVAESDESPQTEVHYEVLDSGRVINQIRLEGAKERLVFREPTPTPVTAE